MKGGQRLSSPFHKGLVLSLALSLPKYVEGEIVRDFRIGNPPYPFRVNLQDEPPFSKGEVSFRF
jgi:hypothetical protein